MVQVIKIKRFGYETYQVRKDGIIITERHSIAGVKDFLFTTRRRLPL